MADQTALVRTTAAKVGCSESVAEERISAREVLLRPRMTSLKEAHTAIKGKHLLHQLHVHYVTQVSQIRDTLSKEYLKRQLTVVVAEAGLHEDIKTIIERRVLA